MSDPEHEHVFVALFAYAGVSPATLDCLIRDLPRLSNLTYHRESADALISRSRSVAASEFLRSGASILVMIDHDISWELGDLERLVQKVTETQAVVAGIYSKRGFGGGVAARFGEAGDHAIGTDRLVGGRYLSTGFFGVHRKVIERMAETLPLTTEDFWPFFMPMLSRTDAPGERPEYLSEDWAFCERARGEGFELYLDLKPRLVHNGSHSYRVIDSQFTLPLNQSIVLRAVKPMPAPLEQSALE
jgi:hypothetical protein